MKLSIVSPVYQAENIIDELVKRVSEEAEKITANYEIILVEDGGLDNSWRKIEACCSKNPKIIGLKLSRNFGQHYAITAGLENATGDYIIVMDCDLQDDPKYFQELLKKIKLGNHIVYTRKTNRNHGKFKNLTANAYYLVFNFLVNKKTNKAFNNIGCYSILSRQVVESFLKFGDYRRHYLLVLRWLGFSHDFIEIEHNERHSGKSSYNFRKLIEHALDGITSQSDKLLKATAIFGFILSLISFVSSLVIILMYLNKPFQAGWASIIVLILFMSGLIISSIGICGIYIGKIFEQTKNRPLYLIEKKINI